MGYRKKPRHKARKHAANKLDKLLKRSDNKCSFCGVEVIRFGRLASKYGQENLKFCNNKWKANHWGKVAVKTDEGYIFIDVATVEHLIDIEHPETNHIQNLAVACFKCNQLRGQEKYEQQNTRLRQERLNNPS